MAFSASDAAFEGFRIVRRRPLSVLVWALAYVVFFAVGFLLVGQSVISVMTQIEALEQAGGSPTMTDFAPIMGAYGTIFGVAWPLSILLGTVLSTAIARAVVRPKDSALGYLRLGIDEMRVLGAMVVQFLLLMVYYAVVGGVCVGLGFYAHSSGQGWAWLACVLVGLTGFLALIWLIVRLSLTVPIIVAEGRFTLFGSMPVTRGRFWPLLGMALLAGIMSIVVAFLGGLIAMPIALLTGGPLVAQLETVDGLPTIEILMRLAPALIATGVFNAIVSALQLAILYAPFAEAYRQIKGVEAS